MTAKGMTAKEYLSRVYRLRKLIDFKIDQIKELKELLSEAEGLDYSKEKIQEGSSCADEKIIRLILLENELDRLVHRYLAYKVTVIDQIQRLNNFKHVRVLYERYIANRKLTDIASRLGYSYQYVRLLHGQALKEFETSYIFQQHNTRKPDTIASS